MEHSMPDEIVSRYTHTWKNPKLTVHADAGWQGVVSSPAQRCVPIPQGCGGNNARSHKNPRPYPQRANHLDRCPSWALKREGSCGYRSKPRVRLCRNGSCKVFAIGLGSRRFHVVVSSLLRNRCFLGRSDPTCEAKTAR